MSTTDLFNLKLVKSYEQVDHVNKRFYGRFNYPWSPSLLPAYPPGMAGLFVNQDIGSWNHSRIPERPKIWIAGCGTNQALFTALKFPEAEVLGTDISSGSLDVCRRNAAQLGVKNLELEERSLNEITHKDKFDYVLCTGVVHHNANPDATLKKIAGALKPNGILEFMVYNYYHRLLSTATQNAVREFYEYDSSPDLDLELSLIGKLIAGFQPENLVTRFLKAHSITPEAEMADTLLQPVEYSYTVRSLEKLTGQSNLSYLAQCPNQFDVESERLDWNMTFKDPSLQALYDKLPDVRRWQISNLLLLDKSPMLWFYFQRQDAGIPIRSEQEICEEFLHTRFEKNSFQVRNYILNADGDYLLSEKPRSLPSPALPKHPLAARVYNEVNKNLTIGEVFERLKIKPGFRHVNEVRIRLTSSQFPYLLAVC
ncbi:methyltransferase domain-containing protein [Flavitalea sp. BT771]|uniref:class I SAM-dependent methyltransferase n=1 Tax=Flavitalea sp. BT771 TaxID=3063329 RepID=UPI0026E18CF0|nr:methyltransferase domain-containing protein [Flavitalea sp. BT771]MDO6434606.1 methyltransferase domain-containing protein [Flavitalea sp. BT771]MDV6223506.1 methyltransferase domain-containing protein [Flavitalea sp. BT771]